jgi:hypothetical protein
MVQIQAFSLSLFLSLILALVLGSSAFDGNSTASTPAVALITVLNTSPTSLPALPLEPASPTGLAALSPSPQVPFLVTKEQILQIAPFSVACNRTTEFQDECRTADVTAAWVSKSFERYNITAAVEQAAILAWMAMESADFEYSRNHFPAPGVPGQGSKSTLSLAPICSFSSARFRAI